MIRLLQEVSAVRITLCLSFSAASMQSVDKILHFVSLCTYMNRPSTNAIGEHDKITMIVSWPEAREE